MTSTDYASNQKYSSRSAFKDHIKGFQLNPVSRSYSRNPSLIKPQFLNNYAYISKISLTKSSNIERINSFCSFKSEEHNELFENLFNLSQLKNMRPFSYDFPMETLFKDYANIKPYQPKEINNEKSKKGKAFKLDLSKISLDYDKPEMKMEMKIAKMFLFLDKVKMRKKKKIFNLIAKILELSFSLTIIMDISAHALKLIVIENIVNAIILEIIALIAIVKTVKINHLNMPILISIPTTSILKIEKTRKYVLAQRVVATKIIANASKVETNALLYADA